MKVLFMLTIFSLSIGAFGKEEDHDTMIFEKKLAKEEAVLHKQFPNRLSNSKEQLEYRIALKKKNIELKKRLHREFCPGPSEFCSVLPRVIERIKKNEIEALKREFESRKSSELTKLETSCNSGYKPDCQALNEAKIDYGVNSNNNSQSAQPSPPSKEPQSLLSCKWDTSSNRKLLAGPGCKGAKSICSGEVACTNNINNLVTIRTVTCSEENCGDHDANDCANEKGFSSDPPDSSSKKSMRPQKRSRSDASSQ